MTQSTVVSFSPLQKFISRTGSSFLVCPEVCTLDKLQLSNSWTQTGQGTAEELIN